MECPNCGSNNIERDESRGEYFCNDCGIIIRDNLILSDEYKHEFKKLLWGKNFEKSGAMTYIGRENKDGMGKVLSHKDKIKLNRLRRWQNRYNKFRESRSEVYVSRKIDNIIETMELPKKVASFTCDIFFSLKKEDMVDKWGKDCTIFACVLIACKRLKVPITLKKISKHSGLERKKIGRAYKKIILIRGDILPLQNPRDFLQWYSQNLKLNKKTMFEASNILDKIEGSLELVGKEPSSIVASVIYIACMKGQYRTQSEISSETGVSEKTIRRRYKQINCILQKYQSNI